VLLPSDFRRGLTKITWNNEPWLILETHLVQPGKGGTYMRTKMKNMLTGLIREETFRSAEKFPEADLEVMKMQYAYKADGFYCFTDQDTYETYELNEKQIEDVKDYLKEGIDYTIMFFQEKPISIEPPIFMVLKVVDTVPGVKGDTAQGGSKRATLETGLVINVPLFVVEGDNIKFDTREGAPKYIERVN